MSQDINFVRIQEKIKIMKEIFPDHEKKSIRAQAEIFSEMKYTSRIDGQVLVLLFVHLLNSSNRTTKGPGCRGGQFDSDTAQVEPPSQRELERWPTWL